MCEITKNAWLWQNDQPNIDHPWGMAQLVGHIVFDLKLCGLIPANFFRSNCWVRLPHSSPSHVGLPGVQGKVGCPPTSSSVPPAVGVSLTNSAAT